VAVVAVRCLKLNSYLPPLIEFGPEFFSDLLAFSALDVVTFVGFVAWVGGRAFALAAPPPIATPVVLMPPELLLITWLDNPDRSVSD